MDADDGTEAEPPTGLIAAAGAVGTLVAMTAVGYYALDAPAFGAAVGAAMAAGTYLHLPYFLGADSGVGRAGDTWHDVHLGAAGLALDVGGVVAVALAFVLGPGIQALAGALGIALIGYLVLATLLPRDPAELEPAA